MKVGFVITAHYSDKLRPQGQEFLNRILESIFDNVKYDFKIYIMDNQSQHNLIFPDDEKIHYTRIENQYEKGITGAWNLGLNLAYEDGCDFLFQCNDDLWFNNSINFFIDVMSNVDTENENNIVYVPVTNGVLGGGSQYAPEYSPSDELVKLSCVSREIPNGFCFAFSDKHYEKFRYKVDEYFNVNNKDNGGDGKWGGQEGQFVENAEKGLFGLVVKGCFVHHDKIRGWKTPRNIERGLK